MTTLSYIQAHLDRHNQISNFIDTTLSLQHKPLTILPFNPDLLDDDTDIDIPDDTSNFFLITTLGIPDLIITLDTTDPTDIILNIDTDITHYPSIDNFLLNFTTDSYLHHIS